MTATDGYNPMRWQCDVRGCYNVKHRPKIEIFADTLPGRIAFTDVDATVEVNGHFLFLEWKSGDPRDLPTGQRIYFQRLTFLSDRITCVAICGDAETMEISHVLPVHHGKLGHWQPCDLPTLKIRIKNWADRARIQLVEPQRNAA
jgi:hypothetical protein